MPTIPELLLQRDYKYISLVYLKNDIEEFIKSPLETVSIDNLKNQYSFIICEIQKIDFSIKNIILSQIQTAQLNLKNLETQLSLIPKPFCVDDLPPYSEVFR